MKKLLGFGFALLAILSVSFSIIYASGEADRNTLPDIVSVQPMRYNGVDSPFVSLDFRPSGNSRHYSISMINQSSQEKSYRDLTITLGPGARGGGVPISFWGLSEGKHTIRVMVSENGKETSLCTDTFINFVPKGKSARLWSPDPPFFVEVEAFNSDRLIAVTRAVPQYCNNHEYVFNNPIEYLGWRFRAGNLYTVDAFSIDPPKHDNFRIGRTRLLYDLRYSSSVSEHTFGFGRLGYQSWKSDYLRMDVSPVVVENNWASLTVPEGTGAFFIATRPVSQTPPPTVTALPTLTPTPTPVTTPTPLTKNKVSWRTEVVSLEADNFYIEIEGKKYYANNNTLQLFSSYTSSFSTTQPNLLSRVSSLYLFWQENGVGMILSVNFKEHERGWEVDYIRTSNGRSDFQDTDRHWMTYYIYQLRGSKGSPMESPELGLHGTTNDRSIEGWIHFENLRLQPFINLEPTIPGDINGDGSVTILDFSILASNFGKSRRVR